MRNFHENVKQSIFILGMIWLLAFSSSSYAVTWVISEPDVSPATNGHTYSGPVSYYITYSEELPTLELLDDPGFFELRDGADQPVSATILIRAVDEFTREIRIEDIGLPAGEGSYHLFIYPGTAVDGNGLAIGGVGNPFTADKTPPAGVLTGPFEIDLSTPITVLEEGDDAYYVLDFSVDHILDPVIRELTKADEFPIALIEDDWQTTNIVYLSDEDITATIRTFRAAGTDVVIIRLSNIQGPEMEVGIEVDLNAARDFAGNYSENLESINLFMLNDDEGPGISISAPSPSLSNGQPIIFDVNYENSSVVTLSEDDITVHTTGNLTADMDVSTDGYFSGAVTFSNFVGEGTIAISIAAGTAEDTSGDLAAAAGPSSSAQVDIYGPQVVFGDPNPFYTFTGPATIPVTFVSAIAVTLVPDDIIVTTTGTAAYTSMNLVNTGTATRNVVFSGLSGEGSIFINIPANVAIDQYLQNSEASEDSPAINVGPVPPMSIAISAPSVSATLIGPVSYQVTYQGVQTITLNPADVTLQSSGTATAATITVTGSGLSRTVTLSNISGEGAIAVVIEAGSAVDPVATPIAGITGQAFAVGSNDDDGDLVPDGQEEFIDFTDKDDPADYLDNDLDIVPDYVEIFYDDTNPNDQNDFLDSDQGGTPDYVELVSFDFISSATDEDDEADDQQDSDGDGLPDYLELLLTKASRVAGVFDAADQHSPVTDGDLDDDVDSIANGLEYYLNALFFRNDTTIFDDFDRDAYADYSEVLFGLNPELAYSEKDEDQDGIPNRVEAAVIGNLNADDDQDADGIPDYIEYVLNRARVNVGDSASIYISNRIAGNPLIDGSSDTDADGMFDLDELALGFNPFVNDAPVFQLMLSQTVNGIQQSVCSIDKAAGNVEISVLLSNYQTNISNVNWTNSSLDILNIASIDNKKLVFDPAALANGVYQIEVEVERLHNALVLSSTYTQNLVVSDAVAALDLDNNGLCDAIIPAVEFVAERNTGPISANIIDVDFSYFLRTGQLSALQTEPDSLSVSYTLVQSAASVFAPSETDIADSDFGNLIPRLHFQVTNLSEVGDSISITIPFETLNSASTPLGSVYRLLTNTGWQNFDTSTDQIQSATEACDDSPAFLNGLNSDSLCIRLTIRDGGENDLDGLANGVIAHLGAPALEGAEPVDPPDPVDPIDPPNPFPNFVPGDKQIIVGSAGSFNNSYLLLLALFFFTRKFFLKKAGVIFFPKFLVSACVFACLLAMQTPVLAEEVAESDNGKWKPFKNISLPLDKLYVGAALGLSSLDPDISNIYSVKEDSDTGFKLWLDYQFRERWMFEVEYAKLGASSIEGSEAAIATNVFPAQFSEDISYQHFSSTALYDYPLPYKTLSVFAKAGLAYADVQSDLDIKVADRLSPSFGAGLQYRIQEKYLARFEYETFSEDSNLLSLGISMRLGEPKQEQVPVEEVVTPEVLAEVVEEPVVEETVVAQEEPKSLEEFMAALEPEASTVNMEELYANLKRDLEPSSLFDQGSASLSRRLMGNLDELVYFLDTYPDVRLVITGYASDEGHEYLNENLSRLRAHGAKTYLQANGVDEERVIVRARGEHFPKFGESEEDYRERNRRIEYDFYIPKKK